MLSEIAGIFALGLIVLVAQIGIAPLMDVNGVRPDLMLVFVMALTIRRGAYAGLVAGFAAGLAQDIVSLGFIGVLAFTKSTVAFWSGTWLERREAPLGPVGWLVLLTLAASVQDFVASLFLLQGSRIGLVEYFINTVLPASIYTGIFGFIWSIIPFARRRTGRQSHPKSKRIEL